nr:glycoside hydrolase family 3 protein [Lentzea guizhouensis]
MSLFSRKRAMFGAVGVGVLIASLTQAGGQAAGKEIYLDARASSERRVEDLLRRMTLEEKIGQMAQIRVGKLRGDCNNVNGPLVDSCLKAVLADAHVGSILSGGGDAPLENTPRAWAEMNNAIQRYALENNRLKIPIIYGSDGVHGHNNVISATMFPHQIGLGATWNPGLQEQIGVSASKALRATGVFWNFAPVSDIARDTRWGRYYETYSEDPFLAGQLAAANVRGQQSHVDDTAQLTATAKHFAGYSAPANGHDRGAAQIPVRQLQDVVLPPFQAQFDAGVKTVMINSGSLNGVPVHASKYMLQTQLRDKMGFKGVAVSDWQDMRYLVDRHKIAPDYKTAIAMSVNAGVDMAMEPSNAAEFTSLLLANVRDGSVSRGRIDQAVRRVLKLKFDLGLFEKPYVDPAKADGNVVNVDRSLARQAAAESTVLLKNDGVLPLDAGAAKKIVVTGETADDVRRQLGGWTVEWQGVPEDSPLPPTATVLTGVREAAPGASVVHAPTQAAAVAERGCGRGGRRAGREAGRRGTGRHREPGADAGAADVGRRGAGDRQAGGRGAAHRPPSGAGFRRGRERAGRGLVAGQRGRPGHRRRAVRRGEPERQAADLVAQGAGRPDTDLRPAAGRQHRGERQVRPALRLRARAVVHVVHHLRGDRFDLARRRRGEVHGGEHRRARGNGDRAGPRAATGVPGAHARPAAGGFHPRGTGRWAVETGRGVVQAVPAGVDRRRRGRLRTA